MSYISSLEIKGRNAYAVDVLNKLRRKLLGRASNFGEKDAEVLLESLELNETQNLSSKLIQYSLQNLNNYEESSALELSEIIRSTTNLEVKKEGADNLINLREFLLQKSYTKPLEEINVHQKEVILQLINSAIDNIYSSIISTEWKPKQIKSGL